MTRVIPDGLPMNVADTPTDKYVFQWDNTNKYWKDGAVPAITASTVSLSRDVTGGNATVPNSDTNIVTYSLGNNTYTAILVTGNIEIVTGALSTPQTVTVKIKIGTTVKNYTINTLAAVGNHFRALAIAAAQTSSATVAISHGAAAADANTTTYVYDLIVWGIV